MSRGIWTRERKGPFEEGTASGSGSRSNSSVQDPAGGTGNVHKVAPKKTMRHDSRADRNRTDCNATKHALPQTAAEDGNTEGQTTTTGTAREPSKDNTAKTAPVGKEVPTSPTRPWVENLVGDNATSSTHPKEAVQIRETIPARLTWTKREVLARIDSINDESRRYRAEWKKGEVEAEPNGTPRTNALRRTSRSCHGGDLVWGRLLNPSVTCPWFLEFASDVEAVELSQSWLKSTKLAADASVSKAPKAARHPRRFQARKPEIEPKAD